MSAVDIKMPATDQEGTESAVGKWLKSIGDFVHSNEPLLEVNTDKVSVEVAAPVSGVLKEILILEGQAVTGGDVLGRIEPQSQATASTTATVRSQPKPAESESELSPVVKRLLKEHNLDPKQITGTGKSGRITHQDVLAFLDLSQGGKSTILRSRFVAHTPMRKKIARHMVQSALQTAPHVTSVFEADLSVLLANREKCRLEFQKQGVNLTLTAYFISAAVAALRTVPEVNSRWLEDGIEIYEDYNIGIATALESGGLVVPVLKNAQSLDLLGIAKALMDLTSKARAGRLSSEDLEGGTFTISNHGVSGSLIAAPIIINQPQSAILGIGKLERRPVPVSDQPDSGCTFAPKAYVTLTIDHRVLDGYQANKFLRAFCDALQLNGDSSICP